MSDQSSVNRDIASKRMFEAADNLVQARRKAVLLVEDTAAHAAIIRRALSPDIWEVDHVTRAADALASFQKDPGRIVLLDLSLPDSDGLDLLERLKAIQPAAAFIVVTSTDRVSVSVQAMQGGAWDYVVKADPQQTGQRILESVEKAWQARLSNAEKQLVESTQFAEIVRAQRLEAVEAVVRNVCLEVNNPLSGVVALSQLLQQNENIDSEIKGLADGILRSAQDVAEVVKKLKSVRDSSDDSHEDTLQEETPAETGSESEPKPDTAIS